MFHLCYSVFHAQYEISHKQKNKNREIQREITFFTFDCDIGRVPPSHFGKMSQMHNVAHTNQLALANWSQKIKTLSRKRGARGRTRTDTPCGGGF